MIKIIVDEAYAFDYLSILEVKKNLFPSKNKSNAYKECANYLKDQLSSNIFDKILLSKEYKNLYESNIKTFNLVDIARNNGKVTAKEVDDANMERFFCKQKLQKKFFSAPLIEEKI